MGNPGLGLRFEVSGPEVRREVETGGLKVGGFKGLRGPGGPGA